MQFTEPRVFLIGETRLIPEGLKAFLEEISCAEWQTDAATDAEAIVEIMGRSCYLAFQEDSDLNLNISKIRQGNKKYVLNLLESRHGSVLEHVFFNFLLVNVSRVFTHELVRHRVGTAYSQASLRYVRQSEIKIWLPPTIQNDPEIENIFLSVLKQIESAYIKLSTRFNKDMKFTEKKRLTSAIRRILPQGMATMIGFSVNARALRNMIEQRTDPTAEEEMRFVFGLIAKIMIKRYPHIFGDYKVEMIDGMPCCRSLNIKV